MRFLQGLCFCKEAILYGFMILGLFHDKLSSLSGQAVKARRSGSQYLLGRCDSRGWVGGRLLDAAQPYSSLLVVIGV